MKELHIRLSDELAQQLRDEYAQTYAQHRLSFNAFLSKALAQIMEMGQGP